MAQSPTETLSVEQAQALWAPERPYLNTASFGLPPRPAWDALQAALEDWRHGRTSWEPWGESTERARAAFARLVGTRPELVATGTAVSQFVSLVAATLPRGARVVAPEVDFTSLLFPFLTRGDLHLETVPLERLAEAVDGDTSLVALSAVQSATGEIADLGAVTEAARANGARVLVDATQAIGWLPFDATEVDFVTAAAYKWMMSPRGTAFLAVGPELLDEVRPLAAGWWAGDDPYASTTPAAAARRHGPAPGPSPAWFSWVGAAPALELIEAIGVEAIHAHDVGLAGRFREGLGLEPGDSAIVSVDVPGAEERLARAGIRAAVRAGGLRASFHVYTTERDVDDALDVLT